MAWIGRAETAGGVILRWSLVLFFTGFGFLKFTAGEAHGIAPLLDNSPFFGWLYRAAGERGASQVIGVIEVLTGLLIALRSLVPRLSAAGSLMAAIALVFTLSFLVTTPGIAADPAMSGFLAKDLTLFGAALWSFGEAMSAGPIGRPTRPTRSVA